jgi:hypothetical protein
VDIEIPTDHIDVVKDSQRGDDADKSKGAVNCLKNQLCGSVFNHDYSPLFSGLTYSAYNGAFFFWGVLFGDSLSRFRLLPGDLFQQLSAAQPLRDIPSPQRRQKGRLPFQLAGELFRLYPVR